ncbi:MAG TPA: AbrB/MazE/SpoVT family DNA-binding domain-containing protein [Candidatus Saccharimonas sp.]|nr:AbrB/MazE/SpoVT family DNA-binding domain-containing protein [Candidatus Saccharimonas sp.]
MNEHTSANLVDMVTVGERGQVVIPQAIRERLGIHAGDKLMVFLKHDRLIGLVSQEAYRDFLNELSNQLSQLNDAVAKHELANQHEEN